MTTAQSLPELLDSLALTLLFAGLAIAVIAVRFLNRRWALRLDVLRAVVVLSALPWYAHFRATIIHCAGWGCSDAAVVPRSGLVLFTYITPLAVIGLLSFFMWYAQIRPRFTVLFPIAAGILELSSLRLLQWEAPADYLYVNAAADRWLIVSAVAASLALACYSWPRARHAEASG